METRCDENHDEGKEHTPDKHTCLYKLASLLVEL